MFFKPQPIVSCFKDFEQAVWNFLRVSISEILDHTCVEYCVLSQISCVHFEGGVHIC